MNAEQVSACVRVTDHGEAALWMLAVGVWALVIVGGAALVGEIIRTRRLP